MRFISFLAGLSAWATLSTSTILQNGQVRDTYFPDTKVASIGANSTGWRTYGPNATELSYKGRWDSKHISWWAAPGLKFAFSGQDLAITFGNYTSPGVLIAYRIGGLDWHMTNITAGATHQLVYPSTPGLNATLPSQLPLTFELRVTNWAYGVQIDAVHVKASEKLTKIPNFSRKIEVIGDSLASGMYATYEAFSGFGYTIPATLAATEFSITAYPGVCLHDANCWGNPRGQTYQWRRVSDTSPRAAQIYGTSPPAWNFAASQPADLVIINLGTNDNNTANNVTASEYASSYRLLVNDVHETYPNADIVLMSLWNGFYQTGNSWAQSGAFVDEIWETYQAFRNGESWGEQVHYFNSTGILQHNDIGPQWHPTDMGHVKIALSVVQWVRTVLGWEIGGEEVGPEVQHETLYWNDESSY